MHPLFIIAAGVGTALILRLIRTAKAAKNLKYQLRRIQIYRFRTSEPIVFRVFVDFTNLEPTPITVKQLYLDIFLNFGTAENHNFQRIGTLNTDNIPVTIPANQTVSKSFDVSVPWVNLGAAAVKILMGFATTGRASWPTEAKVEGQLKAVGFTIPVSVTVPFDSNNVNN